MNQRPLRSSILVLLAATDIASAAGSVFISAPEQPVRCFDFIEVTLHVDRPDAANPFTDVRVAGEFQRGGEAPVRVEGFCDAADGSLFRIRFMPVHPGEHRFSVQLRQGDYAFNHEGTFTARAGRLPGPVLVDRDHPFHFVRAGTGEHWFWNGTTTYQLLAWDDDTIAQSVDRLARLGVNRIRVAICGRTRDGKRWNEPLVQRTSKFAFKMEPWQAARPENLEDPDYDVMRFNVGFFQKAERMLRLAR